MAIDPSLVFNLKPVQVADPLAQASQAVNLIGGVQRARAGQQELQSGALDLEQKKQEIADNQTLRQLAGEHGADFDKIVEAAAGRVSPKTLAALQQAATEHKVKMATLTKDQLANQQAQNKLITNESGALVELPVDQQAAAYPASRARLIQQGLAKPEELPGQYPGPEAITRFHNIHAGYDAVFEHGLKVQEEQRKKDEAQRQADEEKRKAALFPSQKTKAEQDALAATQKVTGTEPIQPVETARLKAEAVTAEEAKRHNLSVETTAKLNAAVAAGRLALERTVNGMKYGPGAQEYWVKQLQDNPDSIKEMPPEFRTEVGKKFREATGLPLPTALSASTQTQETAARNALDGIDFIRKALDNPEIQKRLGPILGRLGNAEQRVGAAVGLSPEAEQLAQELRTRMRYFVFQEGKAVLGGRLPQQLMQELESSSASPKMDASTLKGALKGAQDNAQSVMDNADKQRFGGKMRTREMRGTATSAPPAAAHVIEISGKQYKYNGSGATDDLKNYTEVKK